MCRQSHLLGVSSALGLLLAAAPAGAQGGGAERNVMQIDDGACFQQFLPFEPFVFEVCFEVHGTITSLTTPNCVTHNRVDITQSATATAGGEVVAEETITSRSHDLSNSRLLHLLHDKTTQTLSIFGEE